MSANQLPDGDLGKQLPPTTPAHDLEQGRQLADGEPVMGQKLELA